MQRRRGMRSTATICMAIFATGTLAAALSLTGCGITAEVTVPSSSTTPATVSASPSDSPVSTSTASVPASSTAGPTTEPVAAEWKTYRDPGKTISFELPQDWTTQLIPGKTASSVHVEVRDKAGDVVATLQTHIAGLGGACPPKSLRPYTVLSSIPMPIPSNNGDPAAVEPRFVYRLIQGATRFYASYGLTDQAAGKDGKACLVYNTVASKQLGIYMFGDVLQFTGALDGTPGLRAFTSIADAQEYMRSSAYQDVEKMITSLRSLG
ncbi:hypothetical protein [Specibacter sp. RAF43]|uniref:hypothetical protein n=1 Tax=Specibacter sp. RAF43 TaxID=3233057 RepID=UPI003F98A9D6